ncbi:MAG TPA: cupin domain-containing protein [Candidatus Binatia bacterium]|jgi:cupin 2 domain-containing protein|nr:cupin domain-containing protein [Candidatus Binatia bacterium]
MSIQVENILSPCAGAIGSEEFLTLLETEAVKVQRIVSNAAKSPEEFWYEQSYTEWVLLVRGHAVLAFEGGERLELNEGDYLAIPPHARHRVDETGPETIWLVVHLTDGA